MNNLVTVRGRGNRAGPGAVLGRLLLALIVLLPAAGASGHQQKSAVTRILFNDRTNNIEIMHRFFVHDAEHAASRIFGSRQTLMESAESRRLFSDYVSNRFAIVATFTDGETRELPLKYVGEEVDGQYLWVYQEVADSVPVVAMTIVNLALRDIWTDQSNLVTIERDGERHSLVFEGNDEALSISL